jgi:excisionase family DNA binding protein
LDDKRLLTVSEAARRLGIGRSHAYIYVLRGELESIKLGRSRRVPIEAIDDFVERLRSEGEVSSR